MASMQVAETILDQLGGNRFRAMTGARDFVGSERNLTFGLPRYPGLKINKVRVTLDESDTYTVEFMRLARRGGVPTITTLEAVSGVYADSLREVFERQTGLATSL